MTDDRKCFQCGRPIQYVIREEGLDDGWLTCECGERICKLSDLAEKAKKDEEERIKRNLGFYEFKRKPT